MAVQGVTLRASVAGRVRGDKGLEEDLLIAFLSVPMLRRQFLRGEERCLTK